MQSIDIYQMDLLGVPKEWLEEYFEYADKLLKKGVNYAQLDMFEEQAHRRAELKVKPELTDPQRIELVEFYVDEYLVKKGLAWYQDKWYYAKDQYKLLHHLMIFALGKKQSIAGWVLAEKMFNNRNTEKIKNVYQ